MQKNVKIVGLVIMLAGVTGFAAAAAAFEVGDVTIGYSDGYMGRDNQFHVWEHRADAEAYRAKHAQEYRAWRHDDARHEHHH